MIPVLSGFLDQQMFEVIDSALEGISLEEI
jgi:hypothetical protein